MKVDGNCIRDWRIKNKMSLDDFRYYLIQAGQNNTEYKFSSRHIWGVERGERKISPRLKEAFLKMVQKKQK